MLKSLSMIAAALMPFLVLAWAISLVLFLFGDVTLNWLSWLSAALIVSLVAAMSIVGINDDKPE